MEEFYVNVIVGNEDHTGEMSQFGCVCYKFRNWEEASQFIKLSLKNGLIVEVRIPDDAKEEQVI